MDEGPCKSVARSSKDDIELKDLPVYSLCNMKDENGVACAPKGGVACPFPWRLHECLEAVEKEGLEHIVSWAPHGRAFTVHHPDKFVELVLPRCVDLVKEICFISLSSYSTLFCVEMQVLRPNQVSLIPTTA